MRTLFVKAFAASAFVYVLEGTIVEGVRGGKEVTLTLTPGATSYSVSKGRI